MSIHPDPRHEVQSTIAGLRCDIITVPVEDARLRKIVSDKSQSEDARRMAYELANARTTINLLMALGVGETKTLRAAVLDTLERNSSRCCDDDADREALSDAITAALVGGGR